MALYIMINQKQVSGVSRMQLRLGILEELVKIYNVWKTLIQSLS